ncbi:MAG: hypothetical protein M1814_000996 [Vezdaea aestivalis]|nr:MAG: hypothetical protein M1814_000996 [Vezdaea aestivalis]
MDEKNDAVKFGPRIRYASDIEADDERRGRLGLNRSTTQQSSSSMSIRSESRPRSLSRRRTVDPATALPVTYRTVSIEINETKEREYALARAAKEKATEHAVAELNELQWHTISPDELFTRLRTSPTQGLSGEQAQRGIVEYGRNVPSKPKSQLPQKIFAYFFAGFGSILLIASILVFVSWKPLGQPPQKANLALAIVLLLVFFIQAAFNAWQDFSSGRVMASITTMLPDSCLVLRDGAQIQVMAVDLVPGDVLFIKTGNKLPADVRFVQISTDAKFDRSILTGESLPISGTVESTDDNYLETRCIGLQGTHCSAGSGLGVVVATGDRTVFGRIAKLTNKPKSGNTPLQNEVLRFVLIIVSLALTMIVVVIIVWAALIRRKYPTWITVPTLIVDCVSVAVAFIPEGLPIALTASLTITANLMRKNKILCKSLKTVETLGAVSVICSDKTGTLTKNQMFVTECTVGSQKFQPASARDQMVRDKENLHGGAKNNAVDQVRSLSALCNAGEFDAATNSYPLHERRINGDATDQAILRFSESFAPVQDIRYLWTKVFELAFNSKNKFMIRVFSLARSDGLFTAVSEDEGGNWTTKDLLLTIKGAPDILLERCGFYTNDQGQTVPLDNQAKAILNGIKDEWSSQGKRVILLARRILPASTLTALPSTTAFEKEAMKHASSGLTLVGLVGIVDPPRDEILDVVRTLRGAGVRIFMVTGDFKLTAQAIATECGIITNPSESVQDVSALVRDRYTVKGSEKKERPDSIDTDHPTSIILSGPELITLNEEQWEQLCLYDEIVFARTTPEQKLRIVKEFQARSNIVGMTGDGVNDAPSLKAADIGIALGSGSDIAIEASDMVLLESFSAVVHALQYGRVVNDNLKKTIIYLLPAGSFSEFWPIFSSVVWGLPQILSSFLMIIICCFTDCAAAITIAYEKPEADVLLRRPRDPKKDRLVGWKLLLHAFGFYGVIECLCSFAMSYWYAQRKGVPFSALWLKYGALPADINADHATAVLNEASSIYFVNLVVMQWFTLMAIRTRRLSIFQQPPALNKLTQNLYLFPAILFALAAVFFFCYVPAFQSSLNTTKIPVEHFFLPMCFGLVVLAADEARKYAVRRWPKGLLAKMAW